jgi:hypothetical protein
MEAGQTAIINVENVVHMASMRSIFSKLLLYVEYFGQIHRVFCRNTDLDCENKLSPYVSIISSREV